MYTGIETLSPVKQVDGSLSFRSPSTKQQLSTSFESSSSPPITSSSPSATPFSPIVTTEEEGDYTPDKQVDYSLSFRSCCIKQQVSASIESDSICSSPPGTPTSPSAPPFSLVIATKQDRIHTPDKWVDCTLSSMKTAA